MSPRSPVLLLFLLLGLPLLVLSGGLYPPLEPFSTGHLNVSSLHQIYFEVSGNPNGTPVVCIHGGPGSSSSPMTRQFFDPAHYRIVLFDQRGCGKSLPPGELRENDTWELVRDIEKLRVFLGLGRVLLFGGSWGTTLAMLYAQQYTTVVTGLILRGIYTHRVGEADWLFQEGASRIFPEPWQDYLAVIPAEERSDLVEAYYRRLVSADYPTSLQAAREFVTWECKIAQLEPNQAACDLETDQRVYQRGAIEIHYFNFNMFFSEENQLLSQVWKIRHLPATIIHGRYDVVCPLENAWTLKSLWPEAEMHIAPRSGHSQWETEITSLLVDATNKFRNL